MESQPDTETENKVIENVKTKPKRNRKEYMKKYYNDHKEDLLARSKKKYIPKKKNNNIEN